MNIICLLYIYICIYIYIYICIYIYIFYSQYLDREIEGEAEFGQSSCHQVDLARYLIQLRADPDVRDDTVPQRVLGLLSL